MSQPWEAERIVSPELAMALVREQFPELAPRRIEPFGSGWDNTAYLIDGALVFRFPRREVAVELLETEARVLPGIAPHLPLAIPVPEWADRSTSSSTCTPTRPRRTDRGRRRTSSPRRKRQG